MLGGVDHQPFENRRLVSLKPTPPTNCMAGYPGQLSSTGDLLYWCPGYVPELHKWSRLCRRLQQVVYTHVVVDQTSIILGFLQEI